MRKTELSEFRTPQHPSSGTNNWGGASPLLAREIPEESLELKYLRLNSFLNHEVFLSLDDVDDDHTYSVQTHSIQYEEPATPSHKTKRFVEAISTPSRIFKRFSETPSKPNRFVEAISTPSRIFRPFSETPSKPNRTLERFLSKFKSPASKRQHAAALGSNSMNKRRFGIPKLDPQNRWPNGWY